VAVSVFEMFDKGQHDEDYNSEERGARGQGDKDSTCPLQTDCNIVNGVASGVQHKYEAIFTSVTTIRNFLI
jgi:hypothetical protein